jgi:hypothetical protein
VASPYPYPYAHQPATHPVRLPTHPRATTAMVLGMIGTAILGIALLMLVVVSALIIVGTRYDAGYGT